MGRRRASAHYFGLVLCVMLTLVGCVPLYIPPVPAPVPDPEPVTISGDSSLAVTGGTLVGTIELTGIAEPGWLALQWFDPGLREIASDSVWVEPGSVGTPLIVAAPDSLALRAGRWRLVVSFDGVVLRQLDTVVGHEG